jgi:hypothetical protein
MNKNKFEEWLNEHQLFHYLMTSNNGVSTFKIFPHNEIEKDYVRMQIHYMEKDGRILYYHTIGEYYIVSVPTYGKVPTS